MRAVRVGIVLPVHDEEHLIGRALTALAHAVDRVAGGVRCHTVLVLDDCSDRSPAIGRQWGQAVRRRGTGHRVSLVATTTGNVGAARRAGCAALLDRWADVEPSQVWIATTDADSEVPGDWLVAQLLAHDRGADIWSGCVDVRDWSARGIGTAAAWRHEYLAEPEPAHGASLGVNGATYLAAGGFAELATGEDRALLRAAVARGARCHYDRTVPVITSSRADARAPLGFASALTAVEERAATGGSCPGTLRLAPDRGGTAKTAEVLQRLELPEG